MTAYEEITIKNTVDSFVGYAMQKPTAISNQVIKTDRFIRAAVARIRDEGPSVHGVKVITKEDKVILARAD